jgi:hypothetical protein
MECLATVISAYVYMAEAPLMKMELYLSDVATGFRYDLCDNHILITREDPRAPAIKAVRGSYLFRAFSNELRLSRSQAKRVALDPNLAIRRKDVNSHSAKQLLEALHLWTPNFSPEILEEATKLALEPINYYGH